MKSVQALAEHLATRSADELADLLESRRVQSDTRGGRIPQSLDALAQQLLEDRSVGAAVSRLTAPGLQLLSAGVWLAARRHGALLPQPYWTALEPSTRPVATEALLDFLAGDDKGLRAAAERVLTELQRLALVLPAGAGELALPAFLHRHLAEAMGLSRPVAQLMSEAFNAPEVHRIAAGLDLPPSRNRDTAQAAVVAALGDRELVQSLLASAPPAVGEMLQPLVEGPHLMRTHCFAPLGGYHYGPGTKYRLRPGGSGDPATDWLAEHGLLVPVGPDLVELPYEVLEAAADGRFQVRFDPEPPVLTAGVRPVPEALREAQAAAASASRKVELLLAACAAAPPGIRKSGGLAVRDTRRLAKAIEAPEEQTRLWLDLAYNADLLADHQELPDVPAPRGRSRRPAVPTAPLRLLPTGRYDDWLASAPAERLVPLVATWAVIPEVLTWWPEYREETPVALVAPQDQEAVPLRRELLRALASLPPGQGLGPVGGFDAQILEELVLLVGWHSPGLVTLDSDGLTRVLATLLEAEQLGVLAHGRPTPLGEAVLALLETDAADWFPCVPGIAAKGGDAYQEPLRLLMEACTALLPAPQQKARFQADLTAVAAGAPSAALAELMGSAADRESEGHAVVWRFSAASVRRALDGGRSADDLLAELRDAAEGGLPQPLEYLVRDTGRTHGRVRVVRSACCVRSDDEALVLELSKTRVLAKLGLRRIAPTVLISTHSPSATLDALRAAGYAPVLEAESGVTVVERAPGTRAEQRMPGYDRLRRNRVGADAQEPDPRTLAKLIMNG
ncbi:helicase-associated domain-containing protein [Streptacidiphilus carbonis]|uniref:helicase-associated domain-containing protein n=1 Tax=Streptacidiphilus carbonis TaxID=105422 RepID=UPI000694A486|nr:helicase-associated domain-containing protein [Streptacidiphilus carbonis]